MASSQPGKRKYRRPPRQSDAGDSAPPQLTEGWRARLAAELWPSSAAGRRILLAILFAALALRAYKLVSMFPPLLDESIYLRWAEIIDHQGQWFISLLDGKEPLSYWVLALTRKVFGGDPLFEGRALSVVAGLLSTAGMFALGRRFGGEAAGLLAAGLYACFPYALLYDRIAYTEAFVNLFAIAIVLASLWAFEEPGVSWKRCLAPAFALGLGLFTKQTLLLLAFFPLLAGVWRGRHEPRKAWLGLLLIYGVAASFVAVSLLMVPEAPTLEAHDALVHSTRFFVQPQELLQDPFRVAPANLRKLGGFVWHYLTWPVALAGLASLGYLAWRRAAGVWVLASASLLPLLAQVFVLELMYPSRYPFPHFWPWLVLLAWAGADAWQRWSASLRGSMKPAALTVAGLLIAGPMLWQSAGMLRSPGEQLHPEDARNFLGSSAQAGFGVREAADFLIGQSRSGAFVLLTDPFWGPPADTLFAYLNERHGIRAYEAWWMQLSDSHVILPPGEAQVLRSHYERVERGTVDFARPPRVFYVTDTNYSPRGAVRARQPGAQLAASFPKPGGEQFVDVYRLK